MEFPAGSRYSEVAVASIVEIADDLLAYQRQVIGGEPCPFKLAVCCYPKQTNNPA